MSGKNKHITLKEAAKISGYSSDYIGQLIRKGKLPGKQIFSNVAWVTTEEAIMCYMEKKINYSKNNGRFSILKRKFVSKKKFSKFYRIFLYVVVVLTVLFALFLFYILAVSFDKRLEQKSLERIKNGSVQYP